MFLSLVRPDRISSPMTRRPAVTMPAWPGSEVVMRVFPMVFLNGAARAVGKGTGLATVREFAPGYKTSSCLGIGRRLAAGENRQKPQQRLMTSHPDRLRQSLLVLVCHDFDPVERAAPLRRERQDVRAPVAFRPAAL